MSEPTNAESVARYYDTAIFEAELARLTRDCPVERAITLRWLERLAPANAEVAEIGVGGGDYSEYLARKGCRLRLVDVSVRLLDAVEARLRAAGLGESIAGVHRESAARLDSLPAGAFDTVLMLGPLYHLCALEARRQAVAEAVRILRSTGCPICAISSAFSRTWFWSGRRSTSDTSETQSGSGAREDRPGGLSHLSAGAEFRALFRTGFEELALTGVESFSTEWQSTLNHLAPIERTGQTAAGLKPRAG